MDTYFCENGWISDLLGCLYRVAAVDSPSCASYMAWDLGSYEWMRMK